MERLQQGSDTFFRISPAEVESAKAFALRWGDLEGRLDTRFNHPRYGVLNSRLDEATVLTPALGELLTSISSGATPKLGDSSLYAESGVKFLRILNVEDGEILDKDLKYITDDVHKGQLKRSQLADADVLMTITGRVGSAAVVQDEHLPANINQHLVRMRIDTELCRPEFLSEWLNTGVGLELSNRFVSGGTRAALDYDAIRKIRVPLPGSLEIQDRVLDAMDTARAERDAKLTKANAMLDGLDDFVLDMLGVTVPPQPRGAFAIQVRDLSGAMNTSRYQGLQIERSISFENTVGIAGSLIESKFSPSKDSPEEELDWIRIDDLSNRPWQVETVRTEIGKNISGTFFEVQENDILIARLGPTILNSKFVICPRLTRRTVASAEFLVLRCNQKHQAEAVLSVLRTALYRDMMYLRTRGATPSRFRLSGNDLMSIPFPKMDNTTQSVIANEFRHRRKEARCLRAVAESDWREAKQWFERQLLGG